MDWQKIKKKLWYLGLVRMQGNGHINKLLVGVWINCYNKEINLIYIYPLTQHSCFQETCKETGLVDKHKKIRINK